MKINFTSRHTEITPDMKEYCDRRLQSLEKILGYPIEADLILSVEKYRQKVEINIKTKGTTFNTVEETQDMISSLGVAFDQIERRVKKERDKLREKKRRKTRRGEMETSPVEEEPRKRIIRSRDYSPKPMTLDEALIQFDSSKKEVFVFRRFESEKWAVLFRRKDGHIGLIDPD